MNNNLGRPEEVNIICSCGANFFRTVLSKTKGCCPKCGVDHESANKEGLWKHTAMPLSRDKLKELMI